MTVWHNAKRPKSHLIEALRPFLSAFILSVLFDKVNGKFAHFPTIRRNPRFALSNYELYGRMSSRTLLQALTVEFPLETGTNFFHCPRCFCKGGEADVCHIQRPVPIWVANLRNHRALPDI